MAEPTQGLWQEALRRAVRPVWYLGNNRTSQVGVVLTTASAITLLTFYTTEFFGVRVSPYVGIILFLILPVIFVLGLLLIPLGIAGKFRREKMQRRLPEEYPQVDLRDPRLRETLWFVVVMSGLNLALFLTATYRGVHYMDSVEFCGRACHQVMHPEYTAYQNSPHARVACVECHIGPGAPWFVRSKISGAYQVVSVTFDLYPRPIPTPIENLRPSRETCEQCHWPLKFAGERLIVKTHFAEDETNTETKTVLLMHTGGLDPLTRQPRGNHGVHLEPGAEIHYLATDAQRQEIPYVRYRRPSGEVIEYVLDGSDKSAEEWRAAGPLRLMDCMDCHNRPTHTLQPPGAALDAALAAGLLDRSLPYLKKQSLEVLQAEYASQAEAAREIPARLRAFYQKNHLALFDAGGAAIDAASEVLVRVYNQNVFPEMKIFWGTYPNNLGHDPSPGCFRCHSGSHTSADGRFIPSDCNTCHQLLAFGEEEPEILKLLAGP
ncbi:MAG: NapC/NirT family cytochrome c [Acidobacteria bacterium]|nr:NapC/NirT family cytochrome c [Acidobacteriota bacterium]